MQEAKTRPINAQDWIFRGQKRGTGQSTTKASSGEMTADALDWIIQGGSSSSSCCFPNWMIQGQVVA